MRGSRGPTTLVVFGLAIAGFASACRERGRPDPNIRMAVSHEREMESGEGQPGGTVPTKLVVPPEVSAAFSGVKLGWKDAQAGKEGFLEVPIGGAARIPDTNLEVRADVFLPSFSMTTEEITSTGTGEENPAARIAVLEGGNEVFAGWIFKRFPDVHPFQHPRFSIRLEGGVPRKST